MALTRPDGTPWNPDDPEPTYSFQHIDPPDVQGGIFHSGRLSTTPSAAKIASFLRFEEDDEVTRKLNDVQYITTYLNALHGVENQSFTDEEALVLVPKVKNMLRFAEVYRLDEVSDLAKWGWINIELEDEGWNIPY